MTVDDATATLAFEASVATTKPYNAPDQETLVVLSDRTLNNTSPEDDLELAQRARKGELAALTIRLDGTRVVNVAFTHSRLRGTVVLPGSWFDFRPTKAAPGTVAGSLGLARRQWDGHAYACAVEFVAEAAPRSSAAPGSSEATPTRVPQPSASARVTEAEMLTKLLLQAMMQKDEERAIRVLKLGADPNALDKFGRPMLNWAVILCLPPVVQALVDAKADVTHVRPPGVMILQEASDCPEAVKILRAAGAK